MTYDVYDVYDVYACCLILPLLFPSVVYIVHSTMSTTDDQVAEIQTQTRIFSIMGIGTFMVVVLLVAVAAIWFFSYSCAPQVHTSIHPSIHPYIHTSIHPYIHTYIHTHTLTHTHTHTYTYTHTQAKVTWRTVSIIIFGTVAAILVTAPRKAKYETNEYEADVSVYVCMYVCVYVCVYVCMYVCVYVCMYVCMYAAHCLHTVYDVWRVRRMTNMPSPLCPTLAHALIAPIPNPLSTHPQTHTSTHPQTHKPTNPHIHTPTNPHTHTPTHPPIHQSTHPPIHNPPPPHRCTTIP
jgi:hypothetical protein